MHRSVIRLVRTKSKSAATAQTPTTIATTTKQHHNNNVNIASSSPTTTSTSSSQRQASTATTANDCTSSDATPVHLPPTVGVRREAVGVDEGGMSNVGPPADDARPTPHTTNRPPSPAVDDNRAVANTRVGQLGGDTIQEVHVPTPPTSHCCCCHLRYTAEQTKRGYLSCRRFRNPATLVCALYANTPSATMG